MCLNFECWLVVDSGLLLVVVSLEDTCVGQTPVRARCQQREPLVLPLQPVARRGHQPRACRAERMAQSQRASQHVGIGHVDAADGFAVEAVLPELLRGQGSHVGEYLACEGLVEFDHADVAGGDSGRGFEWG